MGAVRRVRRAGLATAVACALTLGVSSVAWAEPFDDAGGGDDGAHATGSGPDSDTGSEPGADDRDPDGGAGADGHDADSDNGGPDSDSDGAGEGRLDLNHPVPDDKVPTVVDYLMFRSSMADFQRFRRQRLLPGQLTWDTNTCQSAPKDPVYDFLPACERREFGFHNYARLDTLESMRERVNSKFKSDLRAVCDDRGGLTKTLCQRQADVYFTSVGAFG